MNNTDVSLAQGASSTYTFNKKHNAPQTQSIALQPYFKVGGSGQVEYYLNLKQKTKK